MMGLNQELHTFRLVYLTSNTTILGELVAVNQFGILLKDPVTVNCNDDKVFFNLFFNGTSEDRTFPFTMNNVISFGKPSDTILQHYNDFIAKVVPEIKELNNQLANTEVVIKYNTHNTLH